MQSIHVPGSVVARVARVLGWAMPSASIVFTALAFSYRWVGDRASMVEVAAAIGPVLAAAREGQRLGHHCSSLVDVHGAQLGAAWAELVAVRAELRVYRAHAKADASRRAELIEQAADWYRARYAEQLEKHPANPAEAARLALLEQWRPDR